MPDMIKDGAGSGYLAKVDSENRLSVSAKTESLQHLVSQDYQQAYQCIGVTTLAVGTVVALHLHNTSVSHDMIVTYIRHQVINPTGGTVFPNAVNYYGITLGRSYVSGGTLTEPVNIFAGSGNKADVVAYQGSPVLEGTTLELDRHYTQNDGDMNIFNKEGSLIVSSNRTVELNYTGDHTGGIIYTRISFIMEERGV